MLKIDQKHRYNREMATQNKNPMPEHFQRGSPQFESTRRKKNVRQYVQKTPLYINSERQGYHQKENQNENRKIDDQSPRISYKFQKERQYVMDDADSLSQIRFISKECSSIKQNNVDIDSNSEALSRNQLEDFSPLFDRIEKNTNDDFILEIEDITQSEPFIQRKMFRKCESVRQMRQRKQDLQEEFMQQPKIGINSGKIKKNRSSEAANNTEAQTLNVNKEIEQVFRILDCRKEGKLTKNNCNSQNLSTQMNYLIGSILTKIKVKGKEYKLQGFKDQFNNLISDSEQSELNEIFVSNRLKKRKVNENQHLKSQNEYIQVQEESQINEEFSSRLSKLDEKLVKYLKKNNIAQKVASRSHSTIKMGSIPTFQKIEKHEFPKPYCLLPASSQIVGKQIDKSMSQKYSIENHSEQYKTQVSLRSYSQTIKGVQGSEFQLSFIQLNKHI